MARVEIDDGFAEVLTELLEASNRSAAELGFPPWTLGQYVKDLLWEEVQVRLILREHRRRLN